MIKKNLLILGILAILNIKAINVPASVKENIEKSIENSGFKKLLKTRKQLAAGNDEALFNRAYKFSSENNVSDIKKEQQAANLYSILTSLNESSAAQEGITENCNFIFNDLAQYDQNQVLKIISSKIDIKGLQSLCPTQVNKLLAATKK